MSSPHEDHGHSQASWVIAAAWILGSAILTYGFVRWSLAVNAIGVAVIVVGTILGIVMGAVAKHRESEGADGAEHVRS